MHGLLNRLRIISKLREGQKIDTTNNGINIYTDGWYNWAIRKFYRDNKDEGTRFLLDTYRSFGQSIQTVIDEYKNLGKPNTIHVLINAATELRNSINGLDNLSKTYANYPKTIAEIEGIIRDYIIVTYNTLLDAIPEERIPNMLHNDIMYGGIVMYKSNKKLADKADEFDD
jgi:hypothetical protein